MANEFEREIKMQLARSAGAAVETLRSIIRDEAAPAAVRLEAAQTILDHVLLIGQHKAIFDRLDHIEDVLEIRDY